MEEIFSKESNPKDNSNFLSKLFFWSELLWILKRKGKKMKNLYPPLEKHKSERLGESLELAWSGEEHFKKVPSLVRALIKVFGLEFFVSGAIYFPFHVAITLLKPYYLSKLLEYYRNKESNHLSEAYIDAAILTAVSFLEILIKNVFTMNLTCLGMKVRIACSSLIYRKSLKLKSDVSEKVGLLITLLTNDVKRLENALPMLHFMWIGPLELAVAGYFLGTILRLTALPGILVLCISFSSQMLLFKKFAHLRGAVAKSSDQRMRLMNDIIANIKTIKLNSWEKPFGKIINEARESELKATKNLNRLNLTNSTFNLFIAELCTYVCILAAVAKGMKLSSEYVFVLKTVYDTIKTPVIINLPDAITKFAELKTAIKRLEEFMTTDQENFQISETCVLKSLQLNPEIPRIVANNVSIQKSQSVLENINFEVLSGEVVAVCGNPGSGKTTFLQLISKEIQTSTGKLNVDGAVSFATQDTWLFPFSIKKNIIFGQDFDKVRYAKVLEVCCLVQDLCVFYRGDDTILSDDFMLNAKQKAKIHLARAIYKQADFYILDDILSILDSYTAQNIFNQCTSFLKDKGFVFVSNNLSFVERSTKIYYLEEGKMSMINVIKFKRKYWKKLNSVYDREAVDLVPSQETNIKIESTKNLKAYCFYGGTKSQIVRLGFLFFLAQFLSSSMDYFLTFWIDNEENPVHSFFETERCLYIYTLLLYLLIFVIMLTTWQFLKFCTSASRNIHNVSFFNVLHGTMSFFCANPCGRIFNRFANDISTADEVTPLHLKSGVEIVFNMIATGMLISIANFYMMFSTLVLFVILLFYNRVFDTNRYSEMESNAQSPLYTHLVATIQGISTIRPSKIHKTLQSLFDNHVNVHTSSYYMSVMMTNALIFWSEITCVSYIGFLIFSFFFTNSRDENVGLAVNQAFQLMMIKDALKCWNDLGGDMVSVERILNYAEIASESSTLTRSLLRNGNLKFSSVSLQLFPLSPTILKKATFSVEEGAKVAFVFSNEATKASLIYILLRMFAYKGEVFIGDVNIKTVPLNLLRSKVSFIPQKPRLLAITIRQNLDPLEEFADFDLWRSLDDANLKDVVSELPDGLSSKMSEKDSTFDLRQKRLLCVARAILKESIIVIVDKPSDEYNGMIENLVKKKLTKCTVLVLASNVKRVKRMDRVFVVKNGFVS